MPSLTLIQSLPALGLQAQRFDAGSESLTQTHAHRHEHGQLVLTLRGVVACEVAGSHWTVPPHCALWIPAGLAHRSRASANARGCFLFIDPGVSPPLAQRCCTLRLSALLRELIIELCDARRERSPRGQALLAALLLDELAGMPTVDTHFPLPDDPRLQRVAQALIANPGDRRTLGQWSSLAGMSERSLSRQLLKDTGMAFGAWRRQLQLMVALRLLAEGKSVQQVAGELGYEAATSFITMFKQAMGTTPARYVSAWEPVHKGHRHSLSRRASGEFLPRSGGLCSSGPANGERGQDTCGE
ncbi:helix-turn-helix domain-containing protein [Pseudomonas sp. MRSN 12121]|uniref:AraC family transcriptional regulator n=1 Tax=Pseudomonas sp. MRSN 12121 TaxID=1611770 RepID=UPI000AD758BE|nr:helix-turn-helix transcriptional regulator [Pseudomonas sp. MRSN 12121]